jgi:non-heme Fe2+,alpha-ketoglutarate-dependent halogenase
MNSETLLKQYRRNGIVSPLSALSELEAQQAKQQYLNICDPGKVIARGEKRLFGHLLHPWIGQLVSHPAVLDAVRALIGPNILVWVSEFNCKAPRTSNFFSWHQDLYYWRHQYKDIRTIPMVTTWLALSNVNMNNGCMQVLPGSHTHLVRHIEKQCEDNLLTRAQEIAVDVDEKKILPVTLSAGEFSIHHPLLYHSSGPNVSDEMRIGLVTRYIAPEVVPPIRPAYTWLVSGEDRCGNWDHVAPLDSALGPELRQRCIQSIQQVTGARFK